MFYTKKEKSKTTDEEAGLIKLCTKVAVTQQSITSVISTEFVKKKTFKVYVEGGFAFHFLDIFIGE